MGPVGGVGHVSAACGASPVVSGLPLDPNHVRHDEVRKGVNVVQVLARTIVVLVVQHCSGSKPSKIGYTAQNFARAAFGGAKSSGNKPLETDRMDLIW